jgi:hypothetical protein
VIGAREWPLADDDEEGLLFRLRSPALEKEDEVEDVATAAACRTGLAPVPALLLPTRKGRMGRNAEAVRRKADKASTIQAAARRLVFRLRPLLLLSLGAMRCGSGWWASCLIIMLRSK